MSSLSTATSSSSSSSRARPSRERQYSKSPSRSTSRVSNSGISTGSYNASSSSTNSRPPSSSRYVIDESSAGSRRSKEDEHRRRGGSSDRRRSHSRTRHDHHHDHHHHHHHSRERTVEKDALSKNKDPTNDENYGNDSSPGASGASSSRSNSNSRSRSSSRNANAQPTTEDEETISRFRNVRGESSSSTPISSASAAERRAAYSHTRELRERRLLEDSSSFVSTHPLSKSDHATTLGTTERVGGGLEKRLSDGDASTTTNSSTSNYTYSYPYDRSKYISDSTTTIDNHHRNQDEMERIRELRARRLRTERRPYEDTMPLDPSKRHYDEKDGRSGIRAGSPHDSIDGVSLTSTATVETISSSSLRRDREHSLRNRDLQQSEKPSRHRSMSTDRSRRIHDDVDDSKSSNSSRRERTIPRHYDSVKSRSDHSPMPTANRSRDHSLSRFDYGSSKRDHSSDRSTRSHSASRSEMEPDYRYGRRELSSRRDREHSSERLTRHSRKSSDELSISSLPSKRQDVDMDCREKLEERRLSDYSDRSCNTNDTTTSSTRSSRRSSKDYYKERLRRLQDKSYDRHGDIHGENASDNQNRNNSERRADSLAEEASSSSLLSFNEGGSTLVTPDSTLSTPRVSNIEHDVDPSVLLNARIPSAPDSEETNSKNGRHHHRYRQNEEQGETRSETIVDRIRRRREARGLTDGSISSSRMKDSDISAERSQTSRRYHRKDMSKDTEPSHSSSSSGAVTATAGRTSGMSRDEGRREPSTPSRGRGPAAHNNKRLLPVIDDSEGNSHTLEKSEYNHDQKDETSSAWSVRVTVISAVDLPSTIMPNMPLCTMLKLGLTKVTPSFISSGDDEKSSADSRNDSNKVLLSEEIESAQMSSTGCKLLSKRDNGSVDFHQEFRWDGVQNPAESSLFVEVCAQGCQVPTNYEGSPMPLAYHDAFRANPDDHQSPGKMNGSVPNGRMDTSSFPNRSIKRSGSGSEDEIMNPGGSGGGGGGGGIRAFWRKKTNRKAAELEAAKAAAVVARMLVEQDNVEASHARGNLGPNNNLSNAFDAQSTAIAGANGVPRVSSNPQSDYNVALQPRKVENRTEICEPLRLGSVVIPLTNVDLEKAIQLNEPARVEKWFPIDTSDGFNMESPETTGKKNPSILLEISVSSPAVLDDSEDELEDGNENDNLNAAKAEFKGSRVLSRKNVSFARRSTINARKLIQAQEKFHEETKVEDPVLESGVIDFIAVIGATDIGNQMNDDGSKGWLKSSPKCGILEQFPPDNDFHQESGRNTSLPSMLEWFCFPEGCRLWRGSGPPSHIDLNLKRFSASSPPNVASSVAAFDACLNCTTSFSWFVIASNSDEYGSKLVKTYGAVIRFYAPAPMGVDSVHGSAAASGNNSSMKGSGASTKRLWIPIGICLTSTLPIVGVMEAMLLRLCEELAAKMGGNKTEIPPKLSEIHKNLAKLIVHFPKPIPGAVNCSVPFLSGERFLLTLPPPTGLPALPHGRSVVSACRLLGAEGLNFLLAAVLTESKILIHSDDIADVVMVAEVVTALCYPFTWSLPYVPILPVHMLEFIEAPLSYLLGVPSCVLKLCDANALEDVVLVDLDSGFSSGNYFEGKRGNSGTKSPPPLPATLATNISKAVYRLLRAEEEVEEEFGRGDYSGGAGLPRLETESLAERQFRISVAIQVSSLLRGYRECVGPVFNRDKFLRISPALFEDRREGGIGIGSALAGARGSLTGSKTKILSPRSKRFLSTLVNTQNFMQLMERLECDDTEFFHEIMECIDDTVGDNAPAPGGMDTPVSKTERALSQLNKALQKVEDKIPTYRVDKGIGVDATDEFEDDNGSFFDSGYDSFPDFEYEDERESLSSMDSNMMSSFTGHLLRPSSKEAPESEARPVEKVAMSLEESLQCLGPTQELSKKQWEIIKLFSVPVDACNENGDNLLKVKEKVKLRDAIGERRYRAWKLAQDQKLGGADAHFGVIPDDIHATKQGDSLDLTTLIRSATYDISDSSTVSSSREDSSVTPEQQRVQDAKNRDVIRRCLDRAHRGDNPRSTRKGNDATNPFVENGRDLMAEAEKALRNSSAQRFLLSILGQRSHMENQRGRPMRRNSGVTSQTTVSRLQPMAFACLVRLSCAMLDACMECKQYEYAYRLLTHSAGFFMIVDIENADDEHRIRHVKTMISRIGLHPIFADLGVWEKVMSLHLEAREGERKPESNISNFDRMDEEDQSVLEYEAAVATLYEMLGYGIPGEELSRFATRASEEYGWFCDDRGKQLLMLARRICVRRELAEAGAAGDTGDIDMIRKGGDGARTRSCSSEVSFDLESETWQWKEIGWCHPAAPTARNAMGFSVGGDCNYMKRSAVTALAAFGSSVIVTGGLDGSVFLAHSISESEGEGGTGPIVRGIHLDWGSASRASSGLSSDGEYGVGAISCLAAAYGAGHHTSIKGSANDVRGAMSEDEIVASMEGSRVVAGTTAGDLRVWSVKDVYSALLMTKKGHDFDEVSKGSHGSGHASSRLRFSLRGRALSGHRGGVTCIDVPSHVYRADSLVTGGADGLIKLWSLRAPTGGRRTGPTNIPESDNSLQQRGRPGDALSVLNGHTGRILCIKTAWHGDRLLSGSADQTLRIWDLAGSGGKCLHTLSGHFGWITTVKYWGPNTIVSAATDRAIALWDARVRSSPLFMLRHHHSPISDLLVGSRTDPIMVSAAADGSLATWDFRTLSAPVIENTEHTKDSYKHCRIVRHPAATMKHGGDRGSWVSGSVLLAQGALSSMSSVLSVGADSVVREWDVETGELIEENPTGHCDAISSFSSFGYSDGLNPESDSSKIQGIISSSWDGTIRMRKVVRKKN